MKKIKIKKNKKKMKTCKELNSLFFFLLTSNHAASITSTFSKRVNRVRIKHVGDGAVLRCTKHTTKCQIEPFQLLIAPGGS